ncbi:MAG: trigger factor [Alphaproteobacteria bacterium]|nr:trigger factor [Alphaproteobacteria bacterium]
MEIKKTKSSGLKRSYDVKVSAKVIAEKKEEQLLKIGETAKVDGFRPGKVPLDVLKKKYESAVMGEVLDAVVNKAISDLFEKEDIRPAAQPNVEIKKFEENEDLEISVDLETIPEVKEIDFSKISIVKPVAKVEDKTIEETLTNIANAHKTSEALDEKRAVKKGDIVSIDFDGKVDGERKPGMKAEKYDLEIGSGMFIPGFEDQVIGLNIGDEKDIKVTFPADYAAKDLAGKDAVFAVKVHELKKKVVPAIDDELAKKMQCKDLEELKSKIKSSVELEYSELTDMAVKRTMLDTLDSKVKLELPESLLEGEFKEIWNRVEEDKKQNPESSEYKGKSDKDLEKEYKGIAERRVKLGLVLADIGNKNKITVSQKEINQAISQEMQKYPGQEKQVLEFYQKNPNAIASIQAPLFEKKVMDFVLELAKVEEKEMSVDDIKAIIEK